MAYTELQAAASSGDLPKVLNLLSRGCDANAIGYGGKWSPLHVAAGRGHDAVVSALLAGRADFRVVDHDGRTARDWAQWSGFHTIAAQLLSLEDNLRPRALDNDFGKWQIVLQENKELQNDIVELHNETVASRRIISGLELDLYSSQMTVGSLNAELKTNRERHSAEVEELRCSLARSRDTERTAGQALEIEELRRSLSKTNDKMMNLESEMKEVRRHADADDAKGTIARDVPEVNVLREDLSHSNSQLACLESELIDARAQLAESRARGNESLEMSETREREASSARQDWIVVEQGLKAELRLEAEEMKDMKAQKLESIEMLRKWEDAAEHEAQRASNAEELWRAESSKVVAISRAFGR